MNLRKLSEETMEKDDSNSLKKILADIDNFIKQKNFEDARLCLEKVKLKSPNNPAYYKGLAKLAQANQEWDEALEMWQKLEQYSPQDMTAVIGQGNALIELGKFEEAETILQKAKVMWPDHPASYEGLARIAYRTKMWTKALKRWQEVESLFPESTIAIIGQGNALIELGEVEKAEKILEKAKTKWPDKPEFYERLAQLAQRREMRQLAYERWDEFTSHFPKHLGARIQSGHALIKLGKLDEARDLFSKASDDWPDHSSPLEGLAYIYQALNQLEKALTLWGNIIERFPKSLDAQIAKGEVLLTLGKCEEAEACFKKAMIKWPDSVEPYDRFAIVAYKSENWSEALVRFEAVTERFPNHVSACLRIGEVLTKLNKWEEATKHYKNLIQKWPNKLGSYRGLARMYQSNEQLNEAQIFLERTIKQFPHSLGLTLQYGNLFIKMDKISQAEQVFAKAANLWPDYSSPIEGLALVAEKKQDWQKALELWDKVIQGYPYHIEAKIQKAKVLLELEEIIKAQTLLNEVAKSSPDHLATIENLAHIASRNKDWHKTRKLWLQVIKKHPNNFNKFICQNLIPLHFGEYLIEESGHFKLESQEVIEAIEKSNKSNKLAVFSNVFRSKQSIPPMDIVYTWVDDQDDVWIRNKEDTLLKLIAQKAMEKYNTEHSKKFRFRNMDELKYSLRSINKYLPFIRNIYIVTAGHTPSWLNYDSGKIFIINHKDIFPNKKHLPTFNSEAIECHVPLIPNLSEYFLYFNDDVMIGRTLQFDDLFLERDIIKLYVDARLSARGQPYKEELGVLSGKKNANVALDKFFKQESRYVLSHVPRLLNTSLCQEAIKVFSKEVELTSSCQFRSVYSHNIANGLYPYYAYYQDRAKLTIIQDTMVQLTDNKELNEQYLWTAYKKKPRFLCIQDMIQDYNKILESQFQNWMNKLYPQKSPFEI